MGCWRAGRGVSVGVGGCVGDGVWVGGGVSDGIGVGDGVYVKVGGIGVNVGKSDSEVTGSAFCSITYPKVMVKNSMIAVIQGTIADCLSMSTASITPVVEICATVAKPIAGSLTFDTIFGSSVAESTGCTAGVDSG
jgi:hypothetical protein